MSGEGDNIVEVMRELRNPRAPSRSRSFRVVRKIKVLPMAKWVKGNKSEEGSTNSSISSYIPFVFLIASVIGLLQVNNLFETHPANMWISEIALIIFCLSHATMKKIINEIDQYGTRSSWSQIIESFRVLSGTLVPVSLSSIFLPHRLWWLLFVIWILLTFIIIAHHYQYFFKFIYTWNYRRVLKAFHSVSSMSNRFIERAHPSRCFA